MNCSYSSDSAAQAWDDNILHSDGFGVAFWQKDELSPASDRRLPPVTFIIGVIVRQAQQQMSISTR